MIKTVAADPRRSVWRSVAMAAAAVALLTGAFFGVLAIVGRLRDQAVYKEQLTAVEARWLTAVSQDRAAVQVYCDQQGDDYYVTVYNSSAYFFSGQVHLYDADGKDVDTLTFHLLAPHTYQHATKQYAQDPVQSLIAPAGAVFYQLTYAQPDGVWTAYHDNDAASSWTSVIMERTDDVQAVRLGRYLFMQGWLAGQDGGDVYVLAAGAAAPTARTGRRPSGYAYLIRFDTTGHTVTVTTADGTVVAQADMSADIA